MKVRAAGRFLMHYAEMVIAMAAGMILLHPLWTFTTHGAGTESVLRSVEVDTLVMATTMTVPMVAWMRFRGHTWASALEMSAAMYAGFVVLYPFLWAGAIAEAGVKAYGHLLMLVLMLLAMLWRRHEYCGSSLQTPREPSPSEWIGAAAVQPSVEIHEQENTRESN